MPRIHRDTARTRKHGLLAELTRPDYFARAFLRAQRRKSVWNLLLIPPFLLGLGVLYIAALHVLLAIHRLFSHGHPDSLRQFLNQPDGLLPIVAFVPPLFAAVPLALITANFLVRLVRPARKALDREATGYSHASFLESQKDLALLASFLVPAALLPAAIAAIFLD